MARTITEAQKTVTLPLTELVPKVGGLSNTIFTQNKDVLYAGQYLVNQYPTTTSGTDLTVPVAVTTQRITGSYLFDVDAQPINTVPYFLTFRFAPEAALRAVKTFRNGNHR